MDEDEMVLAAFDGLAGEFNAHNIDAVMSFCAEDCTLDLPCGPVSHGTRCIRRNEVRRGLMTRFETAPDARDGEIENFACGTLVCPNGF